MWATENRAKYKRDHLRHPSDVTDEEWVHIEPLISRAKRSGRKREPAMRELFGAVMYVLSAACKKRRAQAERLALISGSRSSGDQPERERCRKRRPWIDSHSLTFETDS